MRSRNLRAALGALLLAAIGVSASLAAPPPARPPSPIPIPMRTPLPMPTILPVPTPAGMPGTPAPSSRPGLPSQFMFPKMRPAWRGGRQVALSSLPPLPRKTASNTAYIGAGGRGRHVVPFAANGATINYFADTFFNAACSSTVGTLIPVGCDVFWQSTNLPAGTYDDYYIAANSTTATEVSGGTYASNNAPQEDTPNLNSVGTYVLATLNASTNRWEDVVYVTVGGVNVFGTYADSAANVPQQQFTAANGTNVYVNATGLTQGQYYVVYIESTSGNAVCQYVAPPGTVNSTGFCDPTTSPGIRAVVGQFSSAAITAVWPLSSTTPAGTYSVVLYNLTTGQRLAMRQVSITASGSSAAIALTPVNGNASLGTNWPTPPPSPYSTTTKFAFDSTTEDSDKSWTMSATNLSKSKTYTFTITDPTGAVVSGPTNVTTNASGTGTATYTFGAGNSPSDYIGNTYTVQMLNKTTNAVDASQAFQILGYHATTTFTSPSGTAEVLPQGSSVTSGLQFQNDGDTYYGSGNGDTIRGFAFNTGSTGLTLTLTDSTVTSCGTNCQQEIVTDSNGQSWTVQVNCYGGGANAGCTLTAYPVTSGQTLAINASFVVPNVQFNNVPGQSGCTSGCTAYTSILPTDGVTWSDSSSSSSTNPVYFTNGGGNTYTGTASVTHMGYRDSGNAFTANYETHGYKPNTAQAIYTSTSPFTSTSGYADVWSITATNNASLGSGNITELEIVLPTAYTPSGTTTFVGLDSSSPTNWTVSACPAGAPSSAFCLKTGRGNGGIPPSGGGGGAAFSQTVYIDLNPPPPGAFSYTDWGIQAVLPTPFQMTPASTFTPFVGTQAALDSTATAAYSLNGTLITPGFSPTSEGQNTNNTATITVTNASTAQDPFPDYLDAITIDMPSTNAFTNVSGLTSGWSLLGTTTPSAGVTRYWFGLCAGQFNSGDGPVANPPPVNPPLPNCGSATEASSIAPGSSFTVSGNLQTGTSNITATMYAHGANVGGWSSAHTFNMNVTATSAAAGFSAANGYPTAQAVTSPHTPQVGGDSDTVNGNAYVFQIKNTSGTGNNITTASIRIPGKDTSFVTPNDGTGAGGAATPWTLVGTPAISGTNYGCSITSFSSAQTSGTDGAINIGGAGCKITPNSTITITFNAKAPYTVNDTYEFTTTVNGNVTASENWPTDTIVQIILTASLSISVNPSSPGSGGSTPTVNCPACAFNPVLNEVDYGNAIGNNTTITEGDVVRVSVTTDAGSTVGWKLYVGSDNNPVNTTGPPNNELLTSVDKTSSLGGQSITGLNFDATSYTVIPTPQGSTALTLVDTGSGASARRKPFDFIMNYEISIKGGSTAAQTANLVYTFISN